MKQNYIDNIVVIDERKHDQVQAKLLAKQLGLTIVTEPDIDKYSILLVVTEDRLELRWLCEKKMRPIYVDFMDKSMRYRCQHGGGRKQALAKAIGLKNNNNPSVFDATAGYGQDAFVLAFLGCNVTMVERSPIMGALLQDALDRLGRVANHRISLTLCIANSCHALNRLTRDQYPDVVYVDPMYPALDKSALAKKEMCLLRGLVGRDSDADQLLEIAVAKAKQRVVVKRPSYANPLNGLLPSFSVASKNTRYDIYRC